MGDGAPAGPRQPAGENGVMSAGCCMLLERIPVPATEFEQESCALVSRLLTPLLLLGVYCGIEADG
jgi:hypothetical protein